MKFSEQIKKEPEGIAPKSSHFNFGQIYDYAVKIFPIGSTFVEVGCLLGEATSYLARQIKASDKQIHLICVDTWAGSQGRDPASDKLLKHIMETHNYNVFHKFKKNLIEQSLFDLIVPLQGKSADVAKFFPPKQIDFIFIDAAHDYQSVTEDIVGWKPKMKDGGIMAGHDIKRTI